MRTRAERTHFRRKSQWTYRSSSESGQQPELKEITDMGLSYANRQTTSNAATTSTNATYQQQQQNLEPRLDVSTDIEFQSSLYDANNPTRWLQAVGDYLTATGTRVTIGRRGRRDISSARALTEFWREAQNDSRRLRNRLGIGRRGNLNEYLRDLMGALDDIAKQPNNGRTGHHYNFGRRGDLAREVGLTVNNQAYGQNVVQRGTARTVDGVVVQPASAPTTPSLLGSDPVMTAATFRGTARNTGREGEEIEVVMHIGGLTPAQMVELARQPAGRRGRPRLRRIREARASDAYSIGSSHNIDIWEWDEDAHAVREANPYTTMHIGRNRLENDNGDLEVDQSRDYFSDTYYDIDLERIRPLVPANVASNMETLVEHGIVVRARIRYDGPGDPGRLLLQMKMGSQVDANGMKSARKEDDRTDSPTPQLIAGMDEGLRSGRAPWSQNTPMAAFASLHAELSAMGLLPDIGPDREVLALEAKAHVMSERVRHHLDETSSRDKLALFDMLGANGGGWLGEVESLSASVPSIGAQLTTQTRQIRDKTAFVRAAQAQSPNFNVDVGAIESLWPSTPTNANTRLDKATVQRKRVVAEAINTVLHDLGRLILSNLNLFPDADAAAILARKIQTAGTMARSLWFDDARRTYIGQGPMGGNFLINTFDFAQCVKPEDWAQLTDAQKDGREDIPADVIYHADIVSEVQIELGREQPYLNAIASARGALFARLYMDATGQRAAQAFTGVRDMNSDPAATVNAHVASTYPDLGVTATSAQLRAIAEPVFETAQNADMATLQDDYRMTTWIWGQLTGMQKYLSQLRGENVLREARDGGFNNATWGDAERSKGENAIRNLPRN